MAYPSNSDLKFFNGEAFTDKDWEYNLSQLVEFFGNGVQKYDASFNNIVASSIVGDVSGCTGFPNSDLALVAGENISIGKIVRISSGKFYLASNDSDAGITNIFGVATQTVNMNDTLKARAGYVSGLSGVPIAICYLSTAGTLTTTKPSSRPVTVGVGKSSTEFVFLCSVFEPSVTMPGLNTPGTATLSGSVSLPSLNATSIPYINSSNVLASDSALTYNSSTHTLSATNVSATALNVSGNVPVSRCSADITLTYNNSLTPPYALTTNYSNNISSISLTYFGGTPYTLYITLNFSTTLQNLIPKCIIFYGTGLSSSYNTIFPSSYYLSSIYPYLQYKLSTALFGIAMIPMGSDGMSFLSSGFRILFAGI